MTKQSDMAAANVKRETPPTLDEQIAYMESRVCSGYWPPMDSAVLASLKTHQALLLECQALRKDAELYLGLMGLCGYVGDGSQTTVKLHQDDATNECFVEVGKRTYHGPSMRAAIVAALAARSET